MDRCWIAISHHPIGVGLLNRWCRSHLGSIYESPNNAKRTRMLCPSYCTLRGT